jgi:hypothetical protein
MSDNFSAKSIETYENNKIEMNNNQYVIYPGPNSSYYEENDVVPRSGRRPKKSGEREMPNRLHILRFFRDTEARLRELAQRKPSDIPSDLLQLADEISMHAAALKRELIAEGLISCDTPSAGLILRS